MMVSLEQAERGVVNYYEHEFAQKAQGIGKFTAYFVMPSIPGIIDKNVRKYTGSPLADGVINADGLIDIDTARDRALTAMNKCGSVEVMGFRLNVDDVNMLYDYIARA